MPKGGRDIDDTISPVGNTGGIQGIGTRDLVRGLILGQSIASRPASRARMRGGHRLHLPDTRGITVSDMIMRSPPASNHLPRLRMRGPRGMAIECVLAAFLVVFAAFQVVLVAGA